MNSKYYGQISLTKLGEIARQQPELIKEVEFKDGHKEKLINVSILTNDQPNQYGKIGAIRVDCKDKKDGLNYYVADLKESGFSNQQQQPQPAPYTAPRPQQPTQGNFFTNPNNDGGDLPFD